MKIIYRILIFLIVFSIAFWLLGFIPYFQYKSIEPESLEIPTIQSEKLLSISRPEILAVYQFKYKNKTYLMSSRGGLVEAK